MPKPRDIAFADIHVGDTAFFETVITSQIIHDFAKLSGDFNPLHTDSIYAQELNLKDRIPHGMIAGALFSRLVGMELPGLHSMYMSQYITFHIPLPIEETIIVKGVVMQLIDAMQSIKITTTIEGKKSGEVFVRGEALVRVLL